LRKSELKKLNMGMCNYGPDDDDDTWLSDVVIGG
jgi:hypothetical protein